MNELDPIIGNWYRNRRNNERFEVVALDEQNQGVEIQYFDGQVEELEMDVWIQLLLETIDQPEDASGALDGLEDEDLSYHDGNGQISSRDSLNVENMNAASSTDDDSD